MEMLVFIGICVVFLLDMTNCVDAVLPSYIPVLSSNTQHERNTLIEEYFRQGFQYAEIAAFLNLVHGITISLRHLKRVIYQLGLRRRRTQALDLDSVVEAVEAELSGSGQSVGYRQMHQRITADHGLVVNRETVRIALRCLDPEGVTGRKKHRLNRRKYFCKGPNYLWHMDGYDKLKPFGFCIHGCIDGYSRRIMWLEVTSTNNDPAVVAQYYVDCVRQIEGVPRIIRADCGTENVVTAGLQRFFRYNADDAFAAEKSFMYGTSPANQRIEAWWSFLRKSNADWWIKYFKDLRDNGIYDDSDPLQKACLQFCFTGLLQEELHRIARHWNTHRIRPYPNQESHPGKPDILFFIPELKGNRDYKTPLDLDDLEAAEQSFCKKRDHFGCRSEFSDVFEMLMADHSLTTPRDAEEAKILFTTLRSLLQALGIV